VHGVIEFSNRLLTFVVGVIALATVLAALAHRPRRRELVWLSVAVFLGIPAQAILGGITVRTHLNPWVVGLHFLLSMVVIGFAYALWRRIADPDAPAVPAVPGPLRTLALLTTLVSAAVLVIGTWVTGSGPHAGDRDAKRNGLDPQAISQVHADGVFLLIGLSVALVFAFQAVGASRATRAAVVLVAVELGQGLIGFVQYFTHLPAVLVAAHMLGSCLVLLATLAVLWSTRERRPVAPQAQPVEAAESVTAAA
jgi:cytochrome c oxidase assembly protein subunit 15